MALISSLIVFAFVALVAVGMYFLVRDTPPKPSTEMTDTDVVLYRDAAKLLNRLVTVVDFQGDMSADIMSPETRKKIDAWLIAYKKELR